MINVSLKDGLLLESLGCTLPWGANYFELRELGQPEIRKHASRGGLPTTYYLVWRDVTILGGLETIVATEVDGPRSHWSNAFRKRLTFVRNYIDHREFRSARRAYRCHLSMLSRRLGAPAFSGKRPNESGIPYPHTEWEFEGCRISIGINERFAECCYFGISHIAMLKRRQARMRNMASKRRRDAAVSR